jgi:hypothetical protein
MLGKYPIKRKSANKPERWNDLPPVPPTTTVNLVYSTERQITATAGEVQWDFLINSLFDPDETFTGSQPSYYDEWMALYKKYRVTDVLAEVWCSNASAGHLKVSAAPSGDGITGFTTEDVAGWRNSRESAFNSGGPLAYFKMHVKCHTTRGISRVSLLAEDSYAAGVSASPALPVRLAVRAKTLNATDTVWLNVRLKFRTRFENPDAKTLSLLSKPAPSPAQAAAPAAGECKKITSRLTEHSEKCADAYSCGQGHLCDH